MDNAQKLEMFRQSIDAQAQAEIERAAEELNEKHAAAGKLKTDIAENAAIEELRNETARITAQYKKDISRCDYELKKSVLAHRKELINGFFDKMREKLKDFAGSPAYKDYLTRSIEKVHSTISLGSSTVVFAKPSDIDTVKTLISCEVRPDASIAIGGIRACCEEKNIFADFTLDSALAEEETEFANKSELRL